MAKRQRVRRFFEWIQFEFEAVYELHEMWVWNFNHWAFDWPWSNGVKDALIEYSENGEDWTVLAQVELSPAPGQDRYMTDNVIPFNGILARFVRMTLLTNWGDGWGSGLSEVRFLAFQEAQYPIVNVEATCDTPPAEPGMGPENTVNRSGLNDNDGHSERPIDMWLVPGLSEPNNAAVIIHYGLDSVFEQDKLQVWNPNRVTEVDANYVAIEYAFDHVYELDELHVWNHNVYAGAHGAKDVTIEYSENGTDWAIFGDVQFARSQGYIVHGDYAANTIIDLNDISAKHVRFCIWNTWEERGHVGLSEVRFYTNQAPSLSSALVLDNFEVYGEGTHPVEPAVFDVWIDGYVNGTGSMVGHWLAPYVETGTVHGGTQSMPLFYENRESPYYSEAYRDLGTEFQNWHVNEADALTLYFYGGPDQNPVPNNDRLYVALHIGGPANGDPAVVVYHPDPQALLSDGWQEWTIGFEEFGVDLSNVTRLTVGIGNRAHPQYGGNGVVYIDDIGLTVRPSLEETER